MSSKKLVIIFILASLSVGGVGFYLGTYFSLAEKMIYPSVSSVPDTEVDCSVFWQTWNAIKEKFVEADQLDDQTLIHGASSGLMQSLDDSYSVFFTPEEAKIFEEDLSGIFEGVGMEIGIKDFRLTIISPLEGTPAQKAGLLPEDRIVKIDNQFTQELSLEKAVQLIRGPVGTTIKLIIARIDKFSEKEFTLVREKIKIPTVEWELKNPDTAYIQINHFYNNTNKEFDQIAWQILNHPEIKNIVLDLRNNPGGYLNIVQEVGGWFLESGEVLAIERFSSGTEEVFPTKGNNKLGSYPLVILINQGSASGAEILAGALRDNRKITLVGEQSFGKGSIQQPMSLGDGSMLKLTTAKWLTPQGISIDQQGLSPDIKIEMTEEDYQEDQDPQLDKALEIVKNIFLP